MTDPSVVSDRLVAEAIAFYVTHLYTSTDITAEAIAERVRKKFANELADEKRFTREDVRHYLKLARDRQLLRLVPPFSEAAREHLLQKHNLVAGELTVVNVRDPQLRDSDAGQSWSGEHVAAAGADVVAKLIRELAADRRGREPVRLGLGPGRATLDFCRHLSWLVGADPEFPRLELVAITAGCPAGSPQYAPPSYFTLFPPDRVTCVGLFGETLVRQRDHETLSKWPGVKEAFKKKHEIDIVVSAMGSPRDRHDLLTQFQREAKDLPEDAFVRIPEDVVGNVQYRPYTSEGPYHEAPNELRALTVFELEDFVTMVQEKRHVVLLARQCGVCGMSRADALRPLMKPTFKLWSRLILDAATALELCQNAPSGAA